MITCKYDIFSRSRWKECGKPAVTLRITGPTGDGFDHILCPDHLEIWFDAGLIENIRNLLPSSNRTPKKSRHA